MKGIFDAAIKEFYKNCSGNSLKLVKNYILLHNLYKYKLPRYYQYLEKDDLKTLVSLPCPSNKDLPNENTIKISKMIRNSLDIEEKIACEQCKFKETCKNAFITSKATPVVADYVRFLHVFSINPPNDDKVLKSSTNLFNHLHFFITNIDKYPVALKEIKEPEKNQDQSIQAVKKVPNALKKKKKIPNKFIWAPKADEKLRMQKVELRKKRKFASREVDMLVRRTATVIKKPKKNRRRAKSKPKVPVP